MNLGRPHCTLLDFRGSQSGKVQGLNKIRSEQNLTLSVFFLSKNERLASANDLTSADLAGVALELEGNLLRGLCLLSEHGLGLTTEAFLFRVVATLALSGG